jgi:hypothetical protein
LKNVSKVSICVDRKVVKDPAERCLNTWVANLFSNTIFQRFEFLQPLQQRVALHQVGLRLLLLGGTTWLRISRM